jgi:hypothetical protein
MRVRVVVVVVVMMNNDAYFIRIVIRTTLRRNLPRQSVQAMQHDNSRVTRFVHTEYDVNLLHFDYITNILSIIYKSTECNRKVLL